MKKVIFGEQHISIKDIVDVSRRQCNPSLSNNPDFLKRITGGADYLDQVIRDRGVIYGVTTGFGDSCDKVVPGNHFDTLPMNLVRFHGCGMGEMFDLSTTRAILAVRLTSLALGYSGVSVNLLKGLEGFLIHDVLPLIPQEGSVGASGDLTPLSYVAAALMGEREVYYKDAKRPAMDVLNTIGQKPLKLRPKEGLAIMNGTAAMTGVAVLAYERASYLGKLACRLTALSSLAIKGNDYHFDEKLFAVKPHPGQTLAAARIRQDLEMGEHQQVIPERLQDPYSIRCAPHVIGVLFDAMPMFRQMIEVEINSANDNPIIDPESDSIMHGGHFYGGHIAFAMDSLKNLVANIADLLDRQLQVLVDEKYNRGLPPNLSGSQDAYSYNHGFKAVQIAVSAWTAEALKNTMPASVFSRSTECHNQDKVSMGTISARDCIRVLELSEQVVAACLLAVVQALDLREAKDELKQPLPDAVRTTREQIRQASAFLSEDRALDTDLRKIHRMILNQELELPYAELD